MCVCACKHEKSDHIVKLVCAHVMGNGWSVPQEVLELNGIDKGVFTAAVREALALDRGKYRNVLLVGSTNCAKTFLLKPLKQLYGEELFENPANDKFAWVGADKARVILLTILDGKGSVFRGVTNCSFWRVKL